MSYKDFLIKTGKQDNKESWIDWQVNILGIPYTKALRESQDYEE